MFFARWRITRILDRLQFALADELIPIARRYGQAAIEPLLVQYLLYKRNNFGAELEALDSINNWQHSPQAKKVIPICYKRIEEVLANLRTGESVPKDLSIEETRAVIVLALIQDTDCVPMLLEMLPVPEYFYSVVTTLGKIGDESAIAPLRELLKRTDSSELRDAAIAEALARFEPSTLQKHGVDVSLVKKLATPRLVSELYERLNVLLKRETKAEDSLPAEYGGMEAMNIEMDAIRRGMLAVFHECLALDKRGARSMASQVMRYGFHNLDIQLLCEKFLKETED